jgi:hypothetical protein
MRARACTKPRGDVPHPCHTGDRTKSGRPFGRPKLDGKKEAAVRKALALGNKGILKIAAELGGTVQRIQAAMVA